MQKLVYTIDELAVALGYKSIGAIYKHIYRQNWDAIPQPIRIGSRLAWIVSEVDHWLAEKYKKITEKYQPITEIQSVATLEAPPKKRGRPRKTA